MTSPLKDPRKKDVLYSATPQPVFSSRRFFVSHNTDERHPRTLKPYVIISALGIAGASYAYFECPRFKSGCDTWLKRLPLADNRMNLNQTSPTTSQDGAANVTVPLELSTGTHKSDASEGWNCCLKSSEDAPDVSSTGSRGTVKREVLFGEGPDAGKWTSDVVCAPNHSNGDDTYHANRSTDDRKKPLRSSSEVFDSGFLAADAVCSDSGQNNDEGTADNQEPGSTIRDSYGEVSKMESPEPNDDSEGEIAILNTMVAPLDTGELPTHDAAAMVAGGTKYSEQDVQEHQQQLSDAGELNHLYQDMFTLHQNALCPASNYLLTTVKQLIEENNHFREQTLRQKWKEETQKAIENGIAAAVKEAEDKMETRVNILRTEMNEERRTMTITMAETLGKAVALQEATEMVIHSMSDVLKSNQRFQKLLIFQKYWMSPNCSITTLLKSLETDYEGDEFVKTLVEAIPDGVRNWSSDSSEENALFSPHALKVAFQSMYKDGLQACFVTTEKGLLGHVAGAVRRLVYQRTGWILPSIPVFEKSRKNDLGTASVYRNVMLLEQAAACAEAGELYNCYDRLSQTSGFIRSLTENWLRAAERTATVESVMDALVAHVQDEGRKYIVVASS